MPIKSLVFISLFGFCVAGALYAPSIGLYGYIADYCLGSSGQWWEAPFSGLGIRYSFTLAGATAIGMMLHWQKLQFGDKFFTRRELILLVFVVFVWLSAVLTPQTISRFSSIDHPSVKFTKITIFILMLTHVLTNRKKIDGFLWVLVIVALFLGLQAWDMPRRAFQRGRLEGIGGSDFSEANFFAAFMAGMLPIIGIQLLRTKKLILKVLCVVSAAFTANAIVLCRSRGAFVGLAAGAMISLTLAPRKYRKIIAACLVLGMIGGVYVADPQFIERLTTITASDGQRDESASSRFRLWEAGMRMVVDHPTGIGIGNWYQTIGHYIPEYEGKDSHNTYVKCAAELGLQGIALFGLIILGAFLQLWKIRKTSEALQTPVGDDFMLISYALMLSLVVLLACGLTITMTYMEMIWIMLFLPVCVQRALNNELSGNSEETT